MSSKLTTFKDILLHSPYEKLLEYGLSELEFRQFLLVRNTEYKKIADNILKGFEINDNNKTFYFLKGFSGCGKTTFVRWFIKEIIDNGDMIPNNSNIYREHINLSFTGNSDKRYFENEIIAIIGRKFKNYKPTFIFIEDNFDNISSILQGIKPKYKYLTDLTTAQEGSILFDDAFENLLNDLPVRTLITICLLQKLIISKEKEKDLCFFCIDNLDSLEYSYLIEDFWQDFFYAYNKLVEIRLSMNWDFDIKKKLKILFVLREHNYNLIKANFNKHASDILRPLTSDPFSIVQPDLREILEKRANFAISKGIDVNSNILKLVRIILEEDERYRDKFYLPLFNYDLRKVNQKIIEIATNESLMHFTFDFDRYNYLYNNKQFRNGARGIIIHGFLKTLFGVGMEEKYPIDPIFSDYDLMEDSENVPFCSYCRLLITLIYNLTLPDTKKINKNLDDLHQITKEYFTLDKLIANLRIYPKQKDSIIPYKNVFHWLNNFYNLNPESITHLINISDKTINRNRQFSFDNELNEARTLEFDELETSSLHKVQVRINPSGVVYLRYLIPHFEFLAAYRYWQGEKFIKDKFKPLYLSTDFSAQEMKYEFETLLEDVYQVVERKKRRNDKFLEEKILKNSVLNSMNKYLSSKYIVHFKDTSSSQLYSSRIISTHLRYIEFFRKLLLEDDNFKKQVNENRKIYTSNSKSLSEINNFIINIQKKYVDLYFEKEIYEIFDDTIIKTMQEWKKHILDIRQGISSKWTPPEE